MNPRLAAALEELSLAGIRAEWKITGKHLLVWWWDVNGEQYLYCGTLKPNNDWRSDDVADTRARIRNLILKMPPTPRKRGSRR